MENVNVNATAKTAHVKKNVIVNADANNRKIIKKSSSA